MNTCLFLVWAPQSKFMLCFLLRCVWEQPVYTYTHRFAHQGTPEHSTSLLPTFSASELGPSSCFSSLPRLCCLHLLHKIRLCHTVSEAHFHFLILLNQLEWIWETGISGVEEFHQGIPLKFMRNICLFFFSFRGKASCLLPENEQSCVSSWRSRACSE